MRIVRGAAVLALGLLFASALRGQDAKPPHAVPSEEHAYLHQFVGEWKTTGKATDREGKLVDMAGSDFDRMVLGDFWLFFVHNSEVHDKPFVGHGMIGYDPVKKKYTGIWVDSMSPHMATFEGTVDPATQALTLTSSGVDPMTKKECKGRLVFKFQDPDHRTLQSYDLEDADHPRLILDLKYVRSPSAK